MTAFYTISNLCACIDNVESAMCVGFGCSLAGFLMKCKLLRYVSSLEMNPIRTYAHRKCAHHHYNGNASHSTLHRMNERRETQDESSQQIYEIRERTSEKDAYV